MSLLVELPAPDDQRRADCKGLATSLAESGCVMLVTLAMDDAGDLSVNFAGVKDRLQVIGALEMAKAGLIVAE